MGLDSRPAWALTSWVAYFTSRASIVPGPGHSPFFFSFFKINLFISFLAALVFVAARRLSVVAVNCGYSSLWCAGFSLRWLLFVVELGL